ncbi:Hypothetical_protein [Hexamita inflata]|uniref:Hypothetical_protein n=1 Tax=Hexamita inflata TaxID=28002 RepID=A0ABP1HS95_9EUKA
MGCQANQTQLSSNIESKEPNSVLNANIQQNEATQNRNYNKTQLQEYSAKKVRSKNVYQDVNSILRTSNWSSLRKQAEVQEESSSQQIQQIETSTFNNSIANQPLIEKQDTQTFIQIQKYQSANRLQEQVTGYCELLASSDELKQ